MENIQKPIITDDKTLYFYGRLLSCIVGGDIEILFSTLTLREKQVLKFRFGLKDGVMHTLEETGDSLGVTRERIRQLQAKALDKLRQKLKMQRSMEILEVIKNIQPEDRYSFSEYTNIFREGYSWAKKDILKIIQP